MEAYFQAFAVVIGGTCLVGSCLLTKQFVRNTAVRGWLGIVGIIALLLFAQPMSAFATQTMISFGFGAIGAGLASVALLSTISGVVFAFFMSSSK